MAKPGITDMRTEPCTSSDLYICNGEDLKEFWRSILLEFLRVVDPRESGFMDTLIASELLTDTDLESLSGKDVLVRKDQARKLWFILSQFSLNEFITKVAPDLCEKYYHIIPKKFLATKEQRSQMMTEVVTDDLTKNNCQRHAIERRLRLVTLADLLFHHNCLQFDDYGEICKSTNKPATEGMWNKIFTAFSAAPGGAVDMLEADTRKMLKRYNVLVSADLRDLLLRGFPCTCANTPTSPPTNPDNRVKQVWTWLLKKMDYSGSSPDSTITNADAPSYSPSSTIRTVSADDSESLYSEITIINESTGLPEPVHSVRKSIEACGEINHLHTVESTEYTGQDKAVVMHVNKSLTLQNVCDKKTSSKQKPIKLRKSQEKSSGFKAKLPGEVEISPRLEPPVIKAMDNVNLKNPNFITVEPSAFTTIEMEPSKDSEMAPQKGPISMHISKDKAMTTEIETGPSFIHFSEDKAMATELETRLFLTPISDTEEANLTKLSVAKTEDNQMAVSSIESTIFNQETFNCKQNSSTCRQNSSTCRQNSSTCRQNSSTCRQNAPNALGAQKYVETADTLANARNIGLTPYTLSFISWLLYLTLSALKLVPFITEGFYLYAVLEFALDFSRLFVLVSTLSIVRQINWNWCLELIKKLVSTFDVLSDTKVAPTVEVECEESRL